jgi:diadenylate cyclase
VRRIAEEIEGYIVELGTDGRLVLLQLEELMAGVEDERRQVVRDYHPEDAEERAGDVVAALASLSTDHLLDPSVVAGLLLDAEHPDLEFGLQPRGYRLLSRIPRIADGTVAAMVARYGSLQKVMRSETEDLQVVPDVDAGAARAIKEGLTRLAETTILDRYS